MVCSIECDAHLRDPLKFVRKETALLRMVCIHPQQQVGENEYLRFIIALVLNKYKDLGNSPNKQCWLQVHITALLSFRIYKLNIA